MAFLYRNAGRELETGGYISLARLPQQLLKQHALLSLGVLSLCCFWSAVSTAQSVVMLDSTFLFEVFAWVTSRTALGQLENTETRERKRERKQSGQA